MNLPDNAVETYADSALAFFNPYKLLEFAINFAQNDCSHLALDSTPHPSFFNGKILRII
jgi:hypothetical protein